MHSSIKDFIIKPRFQLGFEFEGLVRESVWKEFRDSFKDLDYLEDGSPIVQFGTDHSIEPIPSGFRAVEIRTQILPFYRGMRFFEDMLCFLYLASETDDWRTNESCGLHINLSEKAVAAAGTEISFYCNILRRFKEHDILELFGRLDNEYCEPVLEREMRELPLSKRISLEELEEKFNEDLYDNKYLAVALRGSPEHDSYKGPKLENNRVEFRCMGNKNYHLRFEDLKMTVDHIETVARQSFRAVESIST